MSDRSLSRQLAVGVLEALKRDGHILVVKGGSEALMRELETLMADHLARIVPRLAPRTVVGEVTSTFGDETVDEAVEAMVAELGKALMDSDHVEDVFAEDNVIQRDIFRVVRDTLLPAAPELAIDVDDEEIPPISVRLETLGYVAATVAKRADDETLRDALERAALAAEGQLASYDPQSRQAMFTVQTGDPDTRLEIEEAVADELSDLVEMGLVELPTIERHVQLSREVPPSERAPMRPRIDAAAAKTLTIAGCGASWEFADNRSLTLTFTPLSEQDGRDVDQHTALFTREVNTLLDNPPVSPRTLPAAKNGSVMADSAPQKAGRADRPAERAKTEPAPRSTRGKTEPSRAKAEPARSKAEGPALVRSKMEPSAPSTRSPRSVRSAEVKVEVSETPPSRRASADRAPSAAKPAAKKAPAAKKTAAKAAAKPAAKKAPAKSAAKKKG